MSEQNPPGAVLRIAHAASGPCGNHVLYVDDEPSVILLMKRLLCRAGFRVAGYSSPGEALDAFLETPDLFDVLVSDLSMPGMDGLELIRRVLAHRPGFPVVLVSGCVPPEERRVAERLGVSAILDKDDASSRLVPALGQIVPPRSAPAELQAW